MSKKNKKIMDFVEEVSNAIKSVGDPSYFDSLEKTEDIFQVKDVLSGLSKAIGKPLDMEFSFLSTVMDNEIAMKIKELIILKLKGHEVNLEDF